MKVLVTGHRGFIGSYLYKRLKSINFDIIGIDLKKGVDLRNYNILFSKLRDYEIPAIFHLAAFIDARESMEKPKEYIENNVMSTLNILEVMRKLDIPYVIFASSAAVYGNPVYLPIDEKHPLNPTNPYGLSKKISEELIIKYSELYGIKYCILRLFNVYGINGKGVISIWLERAKKREPLIIYGGQQTRDFIYVEDVVNVMVEAFKNKITGIYNVGTGKEYRIIDVARIIAKKYNTKIVIEEPRKGDIIRSVANIKKLREWYKKDFVDLIEWLKKV